MRRIIADENLHVRLIKALEENEYEILSIAANSFGISDVEVIETTHRQAGMLLTEDKDFGELVFAYGMAKVTVVFLRYRLSELKKIEENLLKVVADFIEKEGNYFIVITSSKIRIRTI